MKTSFNSQFKKKSNNKGIFSPFASGFTLVELLVSTAIYVIIMVMALSSLLSANSASKSSEGLRATMDNLNFALENMTRNLRLGSQYECLSSGNPVSGGNCPIVSAGDGIRFVVNDPSAGTATTYTYTIASGGAYNYVARCVQVGSGNNACGQITAPELNLKSMKIAVSGAEPNDGQPKVFITLEGETKSSKTIVSFKVQTTVTQRQFES